MDRRLSLASAGLLSFFLLLSPGISSALADNLVRGKESPGPEAQSSLSVPFLLEYFDRSGPDKNGDVSAFQKLIEGNKSDKFVFLYQPVLTKEVSPIAFSQSVARNALTRFNFYLSAPQNGELMKVYAAKSNARKSLAMLDGVECTADAVSFNKALSKVRQDAKQSLQLQAWQRRDKLKIRYQADFKNNFSEGGRLTLFLVDKIALPQGLALPVVVQAEDLGFFAHGHKGPSERVFEVDAAVLKRRRNEAAPLRAILILQNNFNFQILGLAETTVEKPAFSNLF
ncbi:MAG: hypothetical protein J0M35_07490 [Candidatus Obscuribacter phosphatis]|uniref:Uncharacterized protein n=1 Tax=Candidatus Obscuribacter phosphatis TaxID=1906157 RepID=A0A8J7PC57_9BACT|nr:hypothetical protein [Candidatus Obscuribacter phosphatis]